MQIKSRHGISLRCSSTYLLSDRMGATEGPEATECEHMGYVMGLVSHLYDSVVDKNGLITVSVVCVDLMRNG